MDEKDARELLNEEIISVLETLKELPPDGEEYAKAMTNLDKLYKLRIDEERAINDFSEKVERREMEAEQFEQELNLKTSQFGEECIRHEDDVNSKDEERREQKLWNWVKTGVEVAGIVLPLAFYGVWMGKGLKFEETGSFTSTTFRGLIGKFRPTGK